MEGLERPRDRDHCNGRRPETSNFGLDTEIMSRDLTSLYASTQIIDIHDFTLFGQPCLISFI